MSEDNYREGGHTPRALDLATLIQINTEVYLTSKGSSPMKYNIIAFLYRVDY